MAELLVLGISHYPPLTGPDDRMAMILQRMLKNPDLPAHLRTPDGWPEPMRAEWGNTRAPRQRLVTAPPSSAGWNESAPNWMTSTRTSS